MKKSFEKASSEFQNQPEVAAALLMPFHKLLLIRTLYNAQNLKTSTDLKDIPILESPTKRSPKLNSLYQIVPPIKLSPKNILLNRIFAKMALIRCFIQYYSAKYSDFLISIIFDTWCDYLSFDVCETIECLNNFNSLFNDIQSFSSSLAKSCKRTFSKQEDFIDALNLSMEMAGYLYFLETASPYKLDLHLPWDNNDDDSIKLNSEFIQIEFKPVNISVGKLFSILIYTTMSSLVIE
ncbi:hypothetical protein BB560_001372, partial [Smittium megazygosporum]